MRCAGLAIFLALVSGASGATAHETGAGKRDERALRAYERDTLGAHHAAEHAAERRAIRAERRRWRELSPAERRAQLRLSDAEAQAYAESTKGRRSKVGNWQGGAFELPNIAIHAALLPTGKVLFWGYRPPSGSANVGEAALWDPSLGRVPEAFTPVPPPLVDPDGAGPQGQVPAPIYCAGQSLLPSGELLVAGGNLAWPEQSDELDDAAGLDMTFTFDPWSESWIRQPDLADGHWYPGQALLADGRTAILGGYSAQAPGGIRTDDLQFFHPAGSPGGLGDLAPGGSADRVTGLYPHLFTIPNGDLLLAGPQSDDSAILPVWTQAGDDVAWQDLPDSHAFRFGGTAVLRPGAGGPSSRVTQIGGYGSRPPLDGLGPAVKTTETINTHDARARWRRDASLRLSRSNQNTVVLPDRSLVTVGGGIGFSEEQGNYVTDPAHTRRRVELIGPRDRRWRLGPAQLEDRTYHSTALLLPDGRVFSAGDDGHGAGPGSIDTAEIYEPPYLFRGARPRIVDAPAEIPYAGAFAIASKRARPWEAALVAPSAVTHSADMSQRVVPLDVATRHGKGGIDVFSPDTPGIAPPGWYMLFVLTRDGVPSVAKWVHLS